MVIKIDKISKILQQENSHDCSTASVFADEAKGSFSWSGDKLRVWQGIRRDCDG
jgi:hypothetical protein